MTEKTGNNALPTAFALAANGINRVFSPPTNHPSLCAVLKGPSRLTIIALICAA